MSHDIEAYSSDLRELRQELQAIEDLRSTEHLLHWDQAALMPEQGAETRGRQLALIGTIIHQRLTSDRISALIKKLGPVAERDDYDGALIREAKREHDEAKCLPEAFVSELKNHLAASFTAWSKAKPSGDFGAVRPYLEKTLELSRKKAEFFPKGDHIADPLIDQMDPGMTTSSVRALFSALREELVPLVAAIGEQPEPDCAFLDQNFDEDAQLAFGQTVIEAMGYDFSRGRQDKSAHPFMTRFSSGDIRITTRVSERELTEALFSSIHEAGHALYELQIDRALDATPLGHGTSAGVHESQSRLWENLVSRSQPFWSHYYPKLQAQFPTQLADVSMQQFYRAVNRVRPSLIRTAADEVTYNLHVMLRFELEVEMLEGKVAIKDLPDAWRERMKRDLGVEPTGNTDGVMQDVHWYIETIGGLFQGYTLGNMMSAQFFESAERAIPELDAQIGRGDFAPLRTWLAEHVHHPGKSVAPAELVKKATGAALSHEPLMRYLQKKYKPLYGLE